MSYLLALLVFVLVLWLAPRIPALWGFVRQLFALPLRSQVTPARWAALEDESRKAAYDALTPTDIEILTGLGWDPPHDVKVRIETHRRNENFRRAKEATAKRKAAAAAPSRPMTPEELEAYKRRPLAVRQAEANENITGDPTVYNASGGALGPGAWSHEPLGIGSVIRTSKDGPGVVFGPRQDAPSYEAIYVADRYDPIALIPRYVEDASAFRRHYL